MAASAHGHRRPRPVVGATVTIRAFRPSDHARLGRMFARLSPTTVYRRFAAPAPTAAARLLAFLTAANRPERYALVAVAGGEIVGVASYDREQAGDTAEVALLIEDAWQRRGLGRGLLIALGAAARRQGLTALTARVQGDNRAALALALNTARGVRVELDTGEYRLTIPLAR